MAGDRELEAASLLLGWWGVNKRDFPWRRWHDPYRLLVVEILLRQTRADTVSEFLPGFLASYPDAASLVGAAEQDLAERLQPLGLFRQRARQLRDLAAALLDRDLAGKSASEFKDLPGVGPYSAAVVAAAIGTSAAAVDTNVARVICRVFAVKPSHAEARKSTNVWATAERLVSAGGGRAAVTWAVLDLAASTCTVRRPRCGECPLRQVCVAAAQLWAVAAGPAT